MSEAEVRSLVRTALYDTGGETVEGGFVDRWEAYAWGAIDDLAKLAREGAWKTLEPVLRQELAADGAPVEAAAALLEGLRPYSRELVEDLLADRPPRQRAIGVRAGFRLVGAGYLSGAVLDPVPEVREAAVHCVVEHAPNIPAAGELLLRALQDPEARVRAVAAPRIGFVNRPEVQELLVEHLDQEPVPAIRKAILESILQEVRRLGITLGPAEVRARVGEPIRDLLLRELHHPERKTRYEVVRALERLDDGVVAGALLERLVAERDESVRAALLGYGGYWRIADRALPVLGPLLEQERYRGWAPSVLAGFGARAVPYLIPALDHPASGHAAALFLARVGDASVLPFLTRELARSPEGSRRRELEAAIRQLRSRETTAPPSELSPELQAAIRKRIRELEAPGLGDWVVRKCRDELEALPVHGSQLFVWAVRPDGEVLRLDHEAFGCPVEPEDDPVVRFSVLSLGARRYPELRGWVPAPPPGAHVCEACLSMGVQGETGCSRCSGFGWIEG